MAFTKNTALRTHYLLTPRQSEMRVTTLKGVADEDIRGSRHRVVLIHGLFFGNLAGWYPHITGLLSQRYDVLCYDVRGHGLSQASSRGYDLDQLLVDLNDLLGEIGWGDGPLSVVGHSFGGRLGLELALRRDRKLEKLILIDSPLLSGDEVESLGVKQGRDELSLSSLWSTLPSEVHSLFERGGRRSQRALKRWFRLLTETSLLTDIESTPPVTSSQLSTLRCELWALYGGRSGCVTSWRALEEHVPLERRELWAEGGHFLLNEAPDRVERFLCEALELSHLPSDPNAVFREATP